MSIPLIASKGAVPHAIGQAYHTSAFTNGLHTSIPT